jgi:iron complex outermembrane receptor protein
MPVINKNKLLLLLTIGAVSATSCTTVYGKDFNMEDVFSMSLEELGNVEITTATRQPEKLADSIATTYVITADELKALGVRTIYDALIHLPGINYLSNRGGANRLIFRGAGEEHSSQIVFMVDGHTINSPLSGGAMASFYDHLPVENIKRIEVVQGPVSSLYGANAYLGMINIITRKGDEINGINSRITSEYDRAGHVGNTYNLLYGDDFTNGWQASINFHALNGNGPERHVDEDAVGRSVDTDTSQEYYDVYFQAENDAFNIKGRYFKRHGGGFFGVYSRPGNNDDLGHEYGYLDITYLLQVASELDIELQAAVDQRSNDSFFELSPAGTIPGNPWNPYGLLTNIKSKLTEYKTEIRGNYHGFSGHTLALGINYHHEKLYDQETKNNFTNGIPKPDLDDVSQTANWIEEARRDSWGIYFHDSWQTTDKLNLILDGRYDHYSDFDASFNPRIGLSYQLTTQYQLTALYGTAYRAPGFASQYVANNVAYQGNPDLDAEKITTYEIGLRGAVNDKFHFQTTLFRNEMDDLISIADAYPRPWENSNDVTSQGLEIQFHYNFTRDLLCRANYTYVDLGYEDGYPSPYAPRHSGSLNLDYRLTETMSCNLNTYAQSEGERNAGDPRNNLAGYMIFNATLNADLTSHLSLQFSVFNLGDKDYAYPAPAETIPDDFTAPGRSFVLGMTCDF